MPQQVSVISKSLRRSESLQSENRSLLSPPGDVPFDGSKASGSGSIGRFAFLALRELLFLIGHDLFIVCFTLDYVYHKESSIS